MGWLFCEPTRAALIRMLTAHEENEQRERTCLKHCARGNVLWTVWEISRKETGEVARYIGCDLMQQYRGQWGYKDMEESMHPYYYTCPLSYLDMVPVANEEWREEVRKHHRFAYLVKTGTTKSEARRLVYGAPAAL